MMRRAQGSSSAALAGRHTKALALTAFSTPLAS
jgi:hypothetical protein